MSSNQQSGDPASESEALSAAGKPGRFWQRFWLTFLVVSLAYAWYSFYAPSNRIAWADNYTVAQQQAVELDKPMILFFTGKWCSPCQIMKRQVWADDQVMETVNAAFIPVMIDVGDSEAVATVSHYRIGATPCTVITDSEGNVLQYVQGGVSKVEFLEWLGTLDSSAEGSSTE